MGSYLSTEAPRLQLVVQDEIKIESIRIDKKNNENDNFIDEIVIEDNYGQKSEHKQGKRKRRKKRDNLEIRVSRDEQRDGEIS